MPTQYSRDYYLRNRERMLENTRRWQRENLHRFREVKRQYYQSKKKKKDPVSGLQFKVGTYVLKFD